MNVGRLHRVLKIITLLQGCRTYNAEQLAAECGVSRRTIYRDLNMVERAGIPFSFDSKSGGYQVNASGLLPAVNLSLEEALAIVLLASELGKTGRLPLFQPARDAAAKIESALPLGLRATLGSLMKHMAVRPGPVARHNTLHDAYDLVRRAILRRETLQCVYISFHDAAQIRTLLDPYWLLFHERAWYVIGRSHRDRAVRTFKLGRFKGIEPTGQTFNQPRGFTLEQHLGNAWRLMRGDQTYEVELKFSPLVSPNVAEVNWHPTQRIRWDDEGSVHFTATVDGLDEIVWWVLGYGPHVQVVKPKALAARIVRMARQVVGLYQEA